MNTPLEFYGYNILSRQDWQRVLTVQECPFLQRKCIKQRKSDSQQSIGACIVRYQKQPLIICPHRFLERQQIFIDAIALLNTQPGNFSIVAELEMPGGSVDYFLVAQQESEVIDFLGLEIQSLDTTGSGGIWEARNDLFANNLQSKYKYGINWKMSAKTILIQMYHKAESFEALGKKLILVLQKQFFDYISKEFSTGHFHSARNEDSVHFHIYDCIELNHQLCLRLVERYSTNFFGIERMLKLGKEMKISEQEVIEKIKAKLPNAIEIKI
jgi:hypothetical protein